MANTTSPDFIGRLRDIKRSLMHARRFMDQNPNGYRRACVQAEGDIEELLIDYGFQLSDEREADTRVHTHVDHQVASGSGHNGNFRNRTFDEAKAIYDREASIDSYLGHGKQRTTLIRITTITETLERNH